MQQISARQMTCREVKWIKTPEWRDRQTGILNTSDPPSSKSQTSAGAGKFWRRQSWAEPRASRGINTQIRGEHRVCDVLLFCLI